MLGNLGNDNNFSSSSNVLLNIEAKLDIPMFYGQVNVEFFNN
jgi:hypothetical protein